MKENKLKLIDFTEKNYTGSVSCSWFPEFKETFILPTQGLHVASEEYSEIMNLFRLIIKESKIATKTHEVKGTNNGIRPKQ